MDFGLHFEGFLEVKKCYCFELLDVFFWPYFGIACCTDLELEL